MDRRLERMKVAAFGLVVILACFYVVYSAHSIAGARPNASRPAFDARTVFDKNCATCHGRDGRGKTIKGKLKHTRDLTDARWQQDVSDERLFNSISRGKGKMPKFGKKVSDSDIDALVTFVRALKR